MTLIESLEAECGRDEKIHENQGTVSLRERVGEMQKEEVQKLGRTQLNDSTQAEGEYGKMPTPLKLENERVKRGQNLVLDAFPAHEGERCMQDEWINYFNDGGQMMASMPDFYEAGKSADHSVIKSLRRDFEDTWGISSTRISSRRNNLGSMITHYFGSIVINPDKKRVVIPDYNGTSLDRVLSDKQGLVYLQTLFDTIDEAEEIKCTLQKLSGKKSSKIMIWTPDREVADNLKWVAGLGYGYDEFHIGGSNLGGDGRAREVLIIPAAAKKQDGIKNEADALFSKYWGKGCSLYIAGGLAGGGITGAWVGYNSYTDSMKEFGNLPAAIATAMGSGGSMMIIGGIITFCVIAGLSAGIIEYVLNKKKDN